MCASIICHGVRPRAFRGIWVHDDRFSRSFRSQRNGTFQQVSACDSHLVTRGRGPWSFFTIGHYKKLLCNVIFQGHVAIRGLYCPVHPVSSQVDDDPDPESWAASDVWSTSDAHLRLALLCPRHLHTADVARDWQLWTGESSETLDASAPSVPRQTLAHRRKWAHHHSPGHGRPSRSSTVHTKTSCLRSLQQNLMTACRIVLLNVLQMSYLR